MTPTDTPKDEELYIERLVAESGDPELGIGISRPRLSWTSSGTVSSAQTAYELRAEHTTGETQLHRVPSVESVLVPWPFPPLTSRERLLLSVRAEHGAAGWTPWSAPLVVEAGLFEAVDWAARFVSPGGSATGNAPILTTEVELRCPVASARLYLTALGIYQAWLNDHPVGRDLLAPGWTSYHRRLRYTTHDVTDALQAAGDRVRISAVLGNGWYRGQLGWECRRDNYGDRLGLLAQLEITYRDGTRHVIGTDETWLAGKTGVLADDLYDGQTTNLRIPIGSDAAAGANQPVVVLSDDVALKQRLVAPTSPPIREVGMLPATALTATDNGSTIVDFGQNLVGWVRCTVQGRSGDEVRIRHAEVLEDGKLSLRPLRRAKATDTYLLANGTQRLEPSLTFHGFRYAEISGTTPSPDQLKAVVVSSDLRRTGWFECSDTDVSRLHENVVWSMRGNFVDVPTDCPQRDERLGWTGDIQVFAPTACTLFDVQGFLSSWLEDLACEQLPDGSVPNIVPDVLRDRPRDNAAGWADAATLVPWTLYERYGDIGVLERQYSSMRAWVDRQHALMGDNHLWEGGFQFGDWLDPTAPPENAAAAQADPDVVATAYAARSTRTLAQAAGVLGRHQEAARYSRRAAEIADAFTAAYVSADGTVLSDCQTVYALAITGDLLSPMQRQVAGERLADLVEKTGFHVSTGFLGTPVILDALCQVGRADLAHSMLLTRTSPSWLYPVTMGATTIWERWDSMLPDGSVNPGEMTSFNHYAYGAVADWLYRTVTGIAPTAPGYRQFLVRPQVTGQLDHASARLLTPYGRVEVSWRIDADQLLCDVRVPVGTTARIILPGMTGVEPPSGPGHHTFRVPFEPERKPRTPRLAAPAPVTEKAS